MNATYDDYGETGCFSVEQLIRKDEIIEFMENSSEFVAIAAGYFKDYVTGDELEENWLFYEDGGFIWDTCDIYHVKKYDMKLCDSFVDFALSSIDNNR